MTGQAGEPAGEGRLVVGLVRGIHGLRGAVRVEVLTDDAARFDAGSVMHPEGTDRRLTVRSAQKDGPGLLVHFAEVTDRNAAETLRDAYLEAEPPADAPDDGAYYWHEVIGTPVLTRGGESLGTVEDVFRAGEAEVYVVRGPRGELLVPAVAGVVVELAPRDGRIVIDEEALGLTGEPVEDEARPDPGSAGP